MKKKLLFSILLGMMISVCMSMQNFVQARVTSNDPTVASGGTVSITLSTSTPVSCFKVELTNAGGLTFISASRGGAFSNGDTYGSTINGATAGDPATTLATYTFQAPETTETKQYSVTFYISGMDTEADTTNTSTVTVTGTGGGNTGETGGNTGGSTGGETGGSTGGTQTPSVPEASYRAVNETVYATSKVRVRSTPSTSENNVRGELKKDEAVTRTGIGDNGWSRVTYKGATGYVSSSYLTTTAPAGATQPEPQPQPEQPTEEQPKEEVTGVDMPATVGNIFLAGITAQEGTLEPAFSKEITEYTMTVEEDITEIHFTTQKENTAHEVEIVGNTNLKKGRNNVRITVKAADGSTNSYIIHVIRKGASGLALSTLEVPALNLSIPLEDGVLEYGFKLESEKLLKEIEFTAIANQEGTRVEITGNKDLKEGENVITITLLGENGEEVVYTITVENLLKAGAGGIQLDVTTAIVVGTILLTEYIIGLLFIWKYVSDNKKKKEEFEEDIPLEEMEAIGANAKTHEPQDFQDVENMWQYEEMQNSNKVTYVFDEEGQEDDKKRGKHF